MSLQAVAQTGFERIENAFDASFGGADNPLRHLGALGLYFLWILVATGLYLYIVLDTSIEGVYSSIGWLSREQWYLGGILRSLHRYASDAFVVVMFLHLLREWAYGRYHGFRFYSWITGVPLIWLVYVSGIGGYWIVWDRLAQFSAVATAELLDWLPFFNEPIARNFLAPDSINDRFFTVLVFIHIGVPLMLILGLWAHVNRISRVDYLPSRRVMLATLASFLALALLKPALSAAPADLAQVPAEVPLDWFILFLHPLTDFTSPAAVWALIFGATLLLFALPFLPHPAAAPIAVVDAPNCNGCSRCHADCPYEAVRMAPHPDKPGHKIAIVDADLCAACGICAGSCPSSTPFRSQEQLVTGIDMPQQPVDVMRRQLEARHGREVLREALEVVTLALVVGLEVKDRAQLFEDLMNVDGPARHREPAGPHLLEEADVGVDALRDPGVLHLHRDQASVHPRTMDLPDARRRGGELFEVLEACERIPELGLEHPADHREVDRHGLALKLRQDVGGLGRQEVTRVEREQLAGLHERALQPAEVLGEQGRLLDARAELGRRNALGGRGKSTA